MSAERVTLHKSLRGGYNVRYGSPSSFDGLGRVHRISGGWWTAERPEGQKNSFPTRTQAVHFLVKAAGL